MHQPSAEQPQERPAERRKSSAESPEASGTIGGPSPERLAEIRTEIGQKEKLRDGLIKTYREEFKNAVAKREERDAAMATLESQRISGASKVSDAQMEAFAANDAALNAEDLRRANQYKEDAVELDQEIDRLKQELEENSN